VDGPAPVRTSPPTRNAEDRAHRSLAKAVSWRLTGTIDTMIVSFLVTGRMKLAVSIGFIEVFTKIALYFFHERLWNRISFGRAPARPEYEI